MLLPIFNTDQKHFLLSCCSLLKATFFFVDTEQWRRVKTHCWERVLCTEHVKSHFSCYNYLLYPPNCMLTIEIL